MKDKNIEQQLADKLGSRSIKPSEQSWNRIARNRQQGKVKKQKKRTVIYYAASVVLLMLFTGYFFLSGNNNVITEPKVVDSDRPEKNIIKEEPFLIQENIKPHTEAIVYKKARQEENFKESKKEEQHAIILPYKELKVNESLPEINMAAMPVINAKAFDKDEYYEQQAEYLLNNSIKDIAVSRQFSAPVNDTALLKEVEAEMDEYYREKAMSIFSLKHKTIRIAVKDKQ